MINSTYSIQQQIKNILQGLFADRLFKSSYVDPDTAQLKQVPLAFYMQDVPAPIDDEEDQEHDIAPYCLIQILEGTFKDFNNTREISLGIIFCIYEPDPKKTGSAVIMDLLDTAFKHFASHSVCNGLVIKPPLDFTIQTELNTYPYYFGALQLNIEANGSFIVENDLT